MMLIDSYFIEKNFVYCKFYCIFALINQLKILEKETERFFYFRHNMCIFFKKKKEKKTKTIIINHKKTMLC
jgi:hypothetical protein